MLMPLKEMAERHGCAVLIVRHLNRGAGTDIVSRGTDLAIKWLTPAGKWGGRSPFIRAACGTIGLRVQSPCGPPSFEVSLCAASSQPPATAAAGRKMQDGRLAWNGR